MPYNDMSTFMPSKSAYTNPGEYEATQRNVALSRGTYMAETDKVYAQIKEAARQFDQTYKLETRKVDIAERAQNTSEGYLAIAGRAQDTAEAAQGVKERAQTLAENRFQFTSGMDLAKLEEAIRQFDINAILQQQQLAINAATASSNQAYLESLTEANEFGLITDYIGAASSIFGEGGLWDDLAGMFG